MSALEIPVKIMRSHSEARIPGYATPGSVGFDFYSLRDITINPGRIERVPTGLHFEFPEGHCLMVKGRSSYETKGILCVAGVIDSDYRGEVYPVLLNTTETPFDIKKDERVAQGLIIPVLRANFELTDLLEQTQRGNGGFGSTGR